MSEINVIFDMDGTLIDTECLYRKYWPQAFADLGFELSDERALMLRSLGRPFSPRLMKDWYGEDFDYNRVRERRKQYIEAHIDKFGIELRPGVKELLTWLESNNICTAIATATDLERTTKYLRMVGLEGRFKRIICATMVKQGKPAPDIYEYAMNELGASPDNTLAVEDAPNGVLSAYRAGLKVVYVPDQTPSDLNLRQMLYAEIPRIDGLINIIEELL